jgi:hypothetical protein
MSFRVKKTIVYPLFFFLFSWFMAFPLFAEEGKGGENESDGKALLHLGQWEFDAGGRSIFEQPDKNEFFSQRLVDEKIEKYWIFQ